MAKAKRAPRGKYDEKLKVEGITFDELIRLGANYTPSKKTAAKKPAKKVVKKKSK